jgi:hypothetical protein
MTSATSSPLVFPVGQFLGAQHLDVGRPPAYWNVRVGWSPERLETEDEFVAWSVAHGLTTHIDQQPWTRAVLEAVLVGEAGLAHPAGLLDSLLERRLLVEVPQEPGPALDSFARQHVVHPLLVGLGNAPDRFATDAIGLVGLPPQLLVDPGHFEVWQAAHLYPSLADAAVRMAELGRQVGGTEDWEIEPAAVLQRILQAMRRLIAYNCMYLDVVVDPAARFR